MTEPRGIARVFIGILFALALGAVSIESSAQVLWYGGDIDSSTLVFINNTETPPLVSHVLTNFVVPDNARWHVTALFSNNIPSGPSAVAPFSQARWSIRTGVAPGDFGTVLFSGLGPATQTLTGRTLPLWEPEINVIVSGLSFDLGPGSYYMTVSPVTALNPQYYVGAPVSVNRIGTPGPGGTFQESHLGGIGDFMDKLNSGSASMGVIGTAVIRTAMYPVPLLSSPLPIAVLTALLMMTACIKFRTRPTRSLRADALFAGPRAALSEDLAE